MPLFLIERAIPGASDLTAAQLAEIARTSNAAATRSGCRTPGSPAMSRATRSTTCTRPRTPRRSSSTRAGRVSGRCGRRGDDGVRTADGLGAVSTRPQGLGEEAPAAYSQPMGLLERDVELGILATALADAAAGTGTAIAVSGEPGAGKSALVEAACAAATGLRMLRGGCDPLATPRPLGPFRDLLPEVAALAGSVPLSEVCEASYAALRTEPTVLVVEDLHWVDEASVEVLRFLVRRMRGDAVRGAGHLPRRRDRRPASGPPAAGRLRRARPASPRCGWPPCPSPRGRAGRRHVRWTPRRCTRSPEATLLRREVAKEPDLPLPETVRDAILARTTGIAPEDFEVLQLAAAAPDRLDDRLLPALDVDLPTLRRLHDTGLLTRNQHGLLFRHELARLAVESTIPAGGRRACTAACSTPSSAWRAATPPSSPTTRSPRRDAGTGAALRAGGRAGGGAGRLAQRGGGVLPDRAAAPRRRAARAGDAADEPRVRAVHEQPAPGGDRQHHGDVPALGGGRRRGRAVRGPRLCAVFEYYNARRAQAEQHAERARRSPGRDPAVAYGMARLTRGYLAFQRSEYGITTPATTTATGSATIAHDGLLVRTGVLTAATDLARGRGEARERLLGFIEQARERHLDELASTGYSNLSYLDVEQRRLQAAERVLEESLRVHRRARHPDLQPLADRGPIAAAVPRGALERRARGRRRRPRPLRHAARHAVAAAGLRPGRPAAYAARTTVISSGPGSWRSAWTNRSGGFPCCPRSPSAVADRHARPPGGARGDGTPAGR